MSAAVAADLGKAYRRYARPLHRAVEWIGGGSRHELFWAVQGVSFRVERGSSLGIVGDNGAGKTTLLAMLAGAVTPTCGSLQIAGRTGAILELGAGFHGEFTGRENILLAGQARGLTRREVLDRIDQIIEFSELGEFIDQPVRTYSSGMFLRLAFSIATAAAPDVLIVDEALAVGDQRFQAKCIERIDAFLAGGGTLIFCSHNLYQVKKLCREAIWLEHGKVVEQGPAARVCDAYSDRSRSRLILGRSGRGTGEQPLLEVTRVAAVDFQGQALSEIETGDPATLRIWLRRSPETDLEPGVAVGVVRGDGLICHCGSTELDGVALQALGDGEFFIELHFPTLPLYGGSYHFNIATIDSRRPLIVLDVSEGEAPFSIVNSKTDWGVCRLPHLWRHASAEVGQTVDQGGRRA